MTMDSTGMMMGMPSGRKKTRRGPRKNKRAAEPKDPHVHLGKLKAAMDADDHDTARTCAYCLIRNLRPTKAGAMVAEKEPKETPAEEAREVVAVAPEGPKGRSPTLMAAVKAMRAKQAKG